MILGIAGIFSISQISAAENLKVKVTNPLNESRGCETISLDMKALSGFNKVKPAVYSDTLKKFIPSQLIDNDDDDVFDELVFQADFKANQSQMFNIVEANAANQVQPEYGAVANYIPQRKDDFAWENDKIAFRMYGQELQRTELISSGIDVWVKKVEKPVMQDLYDKGHDYYHSDNPLGIDFFTVGTTLGCGGLGVWQDGKLQLSLNYYDWEIVANGPIRTVFDLCYKPWQMGDVKVSEVKRITLDKGSNFNRIESKFYADVNNVTFAVGIVKCERNGNVTCSKDSSWLSYWQNPDPNFGIIGCAVILPVKSGGYQSAEDEKNYFILTKAKNNSVIYYAGAGWNKTAGFESEEKWTAFVERTAKLIENPLQIQIQK